MCQSTIVLYKYYCDVGNTAGDQRTTGAGREGTTARYIIHSQ